MPSTMKVYKSIIEIPEFKQTVITIGSFDGLHIGHQKIINKLKAKSREYGLENIVITFYPHPRHVLSPADNSFNLLNTREEKIKLFQKMGIDHLVMIPFTFEFSQQTPIEYIEKFLIKNFDPAFIIIGYDHRYGLNRSGDIFFLKQMASKYSFKVLEIKKQEVEDIAISSTKIRNAILEGDIETAKLFANHNYCLSGRVVNGYKYGRKLGFPTANLEVSAKKLVPGDGVYAVRVFLEGDSYDGMMYIGKKPSFAGNTERVIEVHIFDFNFDIYGTDIGVELVSKVRESMKFTDKEELRAQLKLDRTNSMLLLKEDKETIISSHTIAVVILNYNGREYLEEYLPSVIHETNLPVHYIVADNGSSDESIAFLNEYYPEVEVYELDQNYGFAEGYNRVIRSLSGIEYIVFLNSDVETETYWLEPIIALLEEDKQIGMAQPKILSYEDKKLFEYAGAAGGYLDLLAYPFCRGRIFDAIEEDTGQYDANTEIFWTSGAAMVMRKDLFDKLGGFDISFFAHQEEIDLCWRAKKAGYKVFCVGESKVYHLGGGTLSYVNPQKTYLNFRNNLMMLLKNDSFLNICWKFPLRLILDGVAGIKFLLENKPTSTLAILRAHGSVYLKLKEIKEKRRISTGQINACRIDKERRTGRYSGIIIWDYFVKKKNKFSEL